jgi:hypothetical protein
MLGERGQTRRDKYIYLWFRERRGKESLEGGGGGGGGNRK